MRSRKKWLRRMKGGSLHSASSFSLERKAMKRPLGVLFLGVLILVVGLLLSVLAALVLLGTLARYTGNFPSNWELIGEPRQVRDVLLVAAQLVVGIAAVVSGVGLLLLRTWAWLLALALLGCELIIQLSNYFQGHPAYWAMFLSALLVLYLNQRPIREAFNIEPKRVVLPSDGHLETVSGNNGGAPLVTSAHDL